MAGVAQRTGATILLYGDGAGRRRGPRLSLAPSAGDVDIIIAAEMMEAGRAIIRGFVTPDRTTLIASTHRMLAVSEKTVPGDGMASSEEVKAAAELAAQKLVLADMDTAALKVGSVISASLLAHWLAPALCPSNGRLLKRPFALAARALRQASGFRRRLRSCEKWRRAEG